MYLMDYLASNTIGYNLVPGFEYAMEEAVKVKEDSYQKKCSKCEVLRLTEPLLLQSPPWHKLGAVLFC